MSSLKLSENRRKYKQIRKQVNDPNTVLYLIFIAACLHLLLSSPSVISFYGKVIALFTSLILPKVPLFIYQRNK